MKNLWTTIVVKDMAASLHFYNDILKLQINERYAPNDNVEIVFLGVGETQLELISNKHMKNIEHSDFVSTGFLVPSVDEFIDYLKSRDVEIVEGPIEPSPYIKYFFIKDPNGYKIQIVERISTTHDK